MEKLRDRLRVKRRLLVIHHADYNNELTGVEIRRKNEWTGHNYMVVQM